MSDPNVAVIGLQWGDEGKGKIVDALARTCRYVVRFCGGANAGHTVLIGKEKFILHLIPCGILTDGTINVIANGVVFDPVSAMEEITELRTRGVKITPENLRISAQANMVMPWHKRGDVLSEGALGEGEKIGTTGRGIGPCYSDKALRWSGLRVADLLDTDALGEKIRQVALVKNKIFAGLYDAAPMDVEAIVDHYTQLSGQFAGMICNTGALLRKAVSSNQRILFEGGQGSMLDIDHGTFPFVTSSPTTACGIPTGTGLPPSSIGKVVGLIKAYTTRVGAGPFPSELDDETGTYLRDRGQEYGATTGRPRRCGWFDAFAARYAADLSGVSELALSKFDVLTGLKEIKVCTGYRLDSQDVTEFDPGSLHRVECVYQTLPGWEEDLAECRSFEDLPRPAREYVALLTRLIERPIGFISVGPERTQTVVHNTQIEGLH